MIEHVFAAIGVAWVVWSFCRVMIAVMEEGDRDRRITAPSARARHEPVESADPAASPDSTRR
jgi:hypothetical protein